MGFKQKKTAEDQKKKTSGGQKKLKLMRLKRAEKSYSTKAKQSSENKMGIN